MKIYIAGRLRGSIPEYLNNCHDMLAWAKFIRELGHSPYIPCLDLLLGIYAGKMTFRDYFDISKEFLLVCDVLLVLPNWKGSKGVKAEIKAFEKTGRPIIYADNEQQVYNNLMVIAEGKHNDTRKDI